MRAKMIARQKEAFAAKRKLDAFLFPIVAEMSQTIVYENVIQGSPPPVSLHRSRR
jgi:hypothetical protein